MKANEFVKKFGWGKSIELIEFYNRCGSLTCDCDFTYDELKRLVESHELVRSYKGCGKPKETALETAKFTLRHLKSTRKIEIELFGNNNRELELERAIADVESCK